MRQDAEGRYLVDLTPYRHDVDLRDLFPGVSVLLRDPSAPGWPYDGRFTRDEAEAERWRWAYWRRVAPHEAAEAKARTPTAEPTEGGDQAEGGEPDDLPGTEADETVAPDELRVQPDRSDLPFVVHWRAHVASPYGPTSGTTRHVLLVLSTWMDGEGRNAFPAIRTLAQCAACAPSTVKKHLRIAEDQGWIVRTQRKFKGDFTSTLYTSALPRHVVGREAANVGQEAANPGREAANVGREAADPGREGGHEVVRERSQGAESRNESSKPPWVGAVCEAWRVKGYLEPGKAQRLLGQAVADHGVEKVLARLEGYLAHCEDGYASFYTFVEMFEEYAYWDPDDDEERGTP